MPGRKARVLDRSHAVRASGCPVPAGGAVRRRPVQVLLLALLGALVAAALPFSAFAPAAPAQADDGDLLLEITTLAPAVLEMGDTLRVTGRVVNPTGDEIDMPEVRLLMQRHTPSTRQALVDWLDGSSDLNVTPLTAWHPAQEPEADTGSGDSDSGSGSGDDGDSDSDDEPAPDPTVPAGGSVTFTIDIPTTGTFDQFSAWGPRGIEIQARSGQDTASARSTLLWYPDDPTDTRQAELTMLVPLTPTAEEWRTARDEQRPVGEVAAPRLLRVLQAVGTQVSVAVDPALLETRPPGEVALADLAPVEDADAPTLGTQQAQLIEELARPSRELIALGYADTDLTGLAAAGGGDLWIDGAERGRTLFERYELTVADVTWPAVTLSAAAVTVLATDGVEAVVLDDDDIVSTSGVVTSSASVVTRDGSLDALIADADLGAALMAASDTLATGTQATLALSAVMTRTMPESPGGFLAVLPRDIGTSDLGDLSARIDRLQQAPWLSTVTVGTLLERTAIGGASLQMPEDVAVEGAITSDQVRTLLTDRGVVNAYALAIGDVVDDALQPSLLTPLAAALNTDAGSRTQLIDAASTSVAALGSSIHVEAGSDVNLISEAGEIPVTITNDLPVPADVVVQLVPEEIWLTADETRSTTLPAGESATVRIPISAVANGNVTVEVHVLPSEGGPDLAPPASFAVRVRADWENIGTGVVAGLLGVAFVIGLIRTIRRGGRRKAAQ